MPGGGIGNPGGGGLDVVIIHGYKTKSNCQYQSNELQTNLASEVWTYPGRKPGTPGTPGKGGGNGGGAPGNAPTGGAPPGGTKGVGGAPGTIPGCGDTPVGGVGIIGMGGAMYA